MLIAFITVGDPTRRTGGYLYHHEVHMRLRQRGHRVTEIVAGAVDPAAQRTAAAQLGAQVHAPDYDVIVVDALARIVCAPWLATWQAQRPLVAMIHELPSMAGEHADPADRAAEAALLRADWLITVSTYGAATLIERGAPPERITIASGGFDRLASPVRADPCVRPLNPPGRPSNPPHNAECGTAPLAPLGGAGGRGDEENRASGRDPVKTPPQKAGPPVRPYTALCVAQWIPRKQILELVQAWGIVAPAGWQLELIGETHADPAYTAAVHAAIAASAAPVIVRGAVNDTDLAHAYAGADLFVLPSRFEGYGIVFAEALAYGLAVLACTSGPVPELVGSAGLCVPPDDFPALAAGLQRLTHDTALRARLAATARARAAALPTWNDTTARYLEALEQARREA